MNQSNEKNIIRATVDECLSFTDALPSSRTEIIRTIRGEEKMKKKMSFGLVFAVVLVVVMTAAAVAAGSNVFGWFADMMGRDSSYGQMLGKLDSLSTVDGEKHTVPPSGAMPLPETKFDVSQSFYDGESLYLAYTVSGVQPVYDQNWIPTEAELKTMKKSSDMNPELDNENTLISADVFDPKLMDMIEGKGKSGIISYNSYIGDQVYLSGTNETLDVEASDERADEEIAADGQLVGFKQFSKPLLDAARNRDSLKLDFVLHRVPTYLYYDGQEWYAKEGEKEEVRITVNIPRNANAASLSSMQEKEFDRYTLKGTLRVSDVDVSANLVLKSKDGTPLTSMEMKAGELADYLFYADGAPLEAVGSKTTGYGEQEVRMDYTFARPKDMPKEITLVPAYFSANQEQEPLANTQESLSFDLSKAAK